MRTSRSRHPLLLTIALLLVGGLLVAGPAPARAAGESWTIDAVDTPACTDGGFQMSVTFAGLEPATSYRFNTLVEGADGLLYMDEIFDSPAFSDGPDTWGLFDLQNAGPYPNVGTWPIPEGVQLRITVKLALTSSPDDVLSEWVLVVDGCDTGGVLFNGPAADDLDRDLVAIPTDLCPAVPAPGAANGCPTLTRSLILTSRLKNAERKKYVVKGRLRSPGTPALAARQRYTIWQAKKGPDRQVVRGRTSSKGAFRLQVIQPKRRYYAVVGETLVPEVGYAPAVRSPRLRVR